MMRPGQILQDNLTKETAGSDGLQPSVGLATFTEDRENSFSREHGLNLEHK